MSYDLAIIGAGPAGLSASVYASRYKLNNVVIGGVTGGVISQTHEIGNWLGTEKITGFEFAQKAADHVKSYGVEIMGTLVDEIKKTENEFELFLSDGNKIEARAILFAMGSKHRNLGIPGEKEFAGKGVSYCATCDGFFYKNKKVAVVGGSDSAAEAAVYLSKLAEVVYIMHRREELSCESFWKDLIDKAPNVKLLKSTNIREIMGGGKVERIKMDNIYEGKDELEVDGVFVEIGSNPNTQLVAEVGIDCDQSGFIVVDNEMRTNIKGVWAAGDITTGSNKFRQVVTAAAEGAIAAHSIQQYLKKQA